GSDDGNIIGNHPDSSGLVTEDYWIVKLDSGATIQWSKCLGGSRYDEASSIKQTTDGGYIVAGVTNSNDGDVTGNHLDSDSLPNGDYWIVKLDSSGNIQWQKCL